MLAVRKDVLFVADPSFVGSTEMRGRVIVNHLRNESYRADLRETYKNERLSFSLLAKLIQYRTVIFVKKPHYRLIRLLQFIGINVWFDPIDNYEVFDAENKKNARSIRNWIAVSDGHSKFIKDFLVENDCNNSTVVTIRHHHSNYMGDYREYETTGRSVGYVGNLQTISIPDSTSELLKSLDLDCEIHDASNLGSAEIISKIRKLSVFLIFFESGEFEKLKFFKSMTEQRIRDLKPSQKLTLPFSLGVPTIFLPYQSYIEAIHDAGFDKNEFMIAHDAAELNQQLRWWFLYSSENDRLALIKRQQIVAESYSIERILPEYKKLIRL